MHVGRSRHGAVTLERYLGLFFLRLVEKDDIGVFVSGDVEAMLVRSLYQVVVAIDKLYELTLCADQTHVAGFRQSLVALPDVDNFIAKLHQVVQGRHLRAVVYNDDFAFFLAQRE